MWKKGPKQLYAKLFYRYSIMIICIVLILVIYFLSATRSKILETNLDYMKMMTEKAMSYLEESKDAVDTINRDFYQSETVLKDLLAYFRMNDEEYQAYRLNAYMSLGALEYAGFDNFIEKIIPAYPNITSIELNNYENDRMIQFQKDGKRYPGNQTKGSKQRIQEENLAANGKFGFVKELRNPVNMESVGNLVVYFQAAEFLNIREYYHLGEILVYNQNKIIVYQSEDGDMDYFFKGEQEGKADEDVLSSYVNKAEYNGYTVLSYLDKGEAVKIPLSVLLTVLGVGVLLIALGEWGVRSYLLRLNIRLNSILDGMSSVMTGDLSVRLQADADGDELDVIAGNYNEMCQKLERYIQKSYLAEIQQKNAELEVLQSQINPHFLYNTLEAIRMKAICNKDRDVAKMLYSMAVIFRSQVKDEDIITVVQELHYCKKYMELFEYRYPSKFTYEIDCPEELMGYPIMKFLFQPVIENYFIHGIRSEMEGNLMSVRVEKEGEALLIHVEDNGRGMTPKELEKRNQELITPKVDAEKSIGLKNVNTRIKALYGPEYGLYLFPRQEGGLHVLMKVGLGEKKANEESNAGRG